MRRLCIAGLIASMLLGLTTVAGCSEGSARFSMTSLFAGNGANPVVTVDSLLDEMTDLERLTRLPAPAYTTKQFSSYDPKSKSPEEEWFANADCGQYLRIEEKAGRKEHVMLDADGPGAIVRIWSANPKGTLRIYIDNSETPAVEAAMADLLGGKVPGAPVPIAGERSRGWNLYLPIPYAKHCKVTSDEGGFYYHVNYRTYEPGAKVTSFKTSDLTDLAEKINGVATRLADPRKGAAPPADRKKTPFDLTLKPDARADLFAMKGSKAICGFLVHIEADDIDAAARNVVVYMAFDGEQTVEVPIGDFFGTAPGLNAFASIPMGITEGKTPDLWCHYYMPFAKNARIAVKNFGEQAVRIHGAVAVVPYKWNDRSLHFNVGWRIERSVPTRPFTDWAHLECSGAGRFVGGHLQIQNPVKTWWGEGDEKIYVDGETFPSHFGTGTEDYYGYAWCCNEPFVHAYHNQPRCDGPGNYGNTSVSRFHIIDDIPFTKSFKFDIENWHWQENSTTNRSATNYWYARPGGSDFFTPITRADVKLDIVEPIKVHKIAGALEGEKLPILEKTGGKTLAQELGGFSNDTAKWSSDTHLWWTEGKPGDKLTVGFDAPQAGKKHVVVHLTKAPDYGQVQLYVNGQKAGQAIDLYNKTVVPANPIDLGECDLTKGQNKLSAEIVGANEAAIKQYMFGLDCIVLK